MNSRKIDAAFFFGTSAELIKLWPLMIEIEKKTSVSLLTTNQQPTELRDLEERFGLRSVTHLRSPLKGNLVSKVQVLPWFITVVFRSIMQLRKLKKVARSGDKDVLVFVHGDTMTCVVGALAGRLSGCEVVHVEAGLRSHDWRNPFPEEIDRMIVARLAHYHFAPDQIAVDNLQGRKGEIVNTRGNTARDSMRILQTDSRLARSTDKYTLVSLHRAELLANKQCLTNTVRELVDSAEERRLIMVLDALTKSTLSSLKLDLQLNSSNIQLHDKMPYPEFIKLVMGAERVITDSGGLQEECGFLSIPCLVHRKATERFDGIGSTARLSLWEVGAITDFILMDLNGSAHSSMHLIDEPGSPTGLILDSLANHGLL